MAVWLWIYDNDFALTTFHSLRLLFWFFFPFVFPWQLYNANLYHKSEMFFRMQSHESQEG